MVELEAMMQINRNSGNARSIRRSDVTPPPVPQGADGRGAYFTAHPEHLRSLGDSLFAVLLDMYISTASLCKSVKENMYFCGLISELDLSVGFVFHLLSHEHSFSTRLFI